MRRLAQLATVLLFLAALVTPVAEFFDRWDSAGLNDDTEFATFAFVLMLTFVLVVCVLLCQLALRFVSLVTSLFEGASDDPRSSFASKHSGFPEPPIAAPLRI
jgi:hypothetical protein